MSILYPSASPSSTLLMSWQEALRFRIGVEGVTGLDQLPDSTSFPDEFLVDEFGTGHFLGEVLGIAALKLFLTSGTAFPGGAPFDTIGQWLAALACSDRTTDAGRLHAVHRVIDLALYVPQRLPLLNCRIASLGNADLHRMAMDAIRGRPIVPDVFEGLD